MLRRQIFFTKTSKWFSFFLILVVLTLAFALAANGEDDNAPDFSAHAGTWKSVEISPAVEITLSEQIKGGYFRNNQYFTGRVTCNIFSKGYLDVTSLDKSGAGNKYIAAGIVKVGPITNRTIVVKAREEVDDGSGNLVANELYLQGQLADDNTLEVVRLSIIQKNKTVYEFNLGDGDFPVFKKQQ
jgi:hypothetical protein